MPMKIQVVSQKPYSIRIDLDEREAKYLRMALERATFLDTPPGEQRGIYNFAEKLLDELEELAK